MVRVSKVEYLVLSHITGQNSAPGNLITYPVLLHLEPLSVPTKAARDKSRLVVVGRQERASHSQVSVTHCQESEVYS